MYWGFAIFVPVAVMIASYILLWLTPYASFNIPEGTTIELLLLIPLKLLLAVAIYTLTSSFGEEIGWRGYLLPKLAGLGWTNAFLLVGVIHGVFHLPIIFAGNYHNDGNPWLVIPMFIISTILISIMFGAMRMMTDSIWPAAIMHAVHNISWSALNEFTVTESEISVYVGGESGIITLTLYSIVAFTLLKKITRQRGVEK